MHQSRPNSSRLQDTANQTSPNQSINVLFAHLNQNRCGQLDYWGSGCQQCIKLNRNRQWWLSSPISNAFSLMIVMVFYSFSLMFVPESSIDTKSTLVRETTRWRTSDKALPNPMGIPFTDAYLQFLAWTKWCLSFTFTDFRFFLFYMKIYNEVMLVIYIYRFSFFFVLYENI